MNRTIYATAFPLFAMFALPGFVERVSAQAIDFQKPDYDQISQAIADETNLRRAQNGLPALASSKLLNVAAQSHSNDMVRMDFFNHQNPFDGNRKTEQQRIALSGYKAQKGYTAENIAMRSVFEEPFTPQTLAKVLVDQWMNSPGHRENILRQTNTEIGTGAAFYLNKDNLQYVKACQVFSKPDGDAGSPANRPNPSVAVNATPPSAANQTKSIWEKGEPKVAIYVTNKTGQALNVHWVDGNGSESKGGEIPVGAENFTLGTSYPGNLYRFRIDGKLVHTWAIQKDQTHLTVGSATNTGGGAKATPPSAANQNKSVPEQGAAQVTITVTNQTGQALDVVWVDGNGTESKAGAIPVGAESFKLGTTYPGNLYRFKTDGKLVHTWAIQKDQTHLTIQQ